MSQHGLTFSDENGLSYKYEGSCPKLEDVIFTKVTVTGGIWIFYRISEYNTSLAGGADSDIIIIQKPVYNQKLDFSPCSVRRCEDNRDSCTVFEHNNYGGYAKQYQEACFDVCQDFPADNPAGASSMIIWPNKDWQLFTKPNFEGGSKVVKDGWHASPECMGFPNDTLLSLRPR
ncbi:hypothetical protein QZH41_013198 [Actinostola sp. cb2023]|nr:hypothetical protein QZH41_013198 [Actinostola sp. cb2023]